MKKQYVTPESEATALLTEPVMNLAVSGHVPDPGSADSKEDDLFEDEQDDGGFMNAGSDFYRDRSLWDEE